MELVAAPAGEPRRFERAKQPPLGNRVCAQQPERLAVFPQLGETRLEQRQPALAGDLLDRHVVEAEHADVQPIRRAPDDIDDGLVGVANSTA